MAHIRTVLKKKRLEFAGFAQEWIRELNLAHGRVPNEYGVLQGSFYEWLESRWPGAGGDFLVAFKAPQMWRKLMQKLLKKRYGRSRLMNERFYLYLNYEVTSKVVLAGKRNYKICPTCNSRVLDTAVQVAQPTDVEILKAYRDLLDRQSKS